MTKKTAVLITNLGSPAAADTRSVKRYLREFLRDKRVVEIPHFVWLPLLIGIILPVRSPKSAALYQRIWTDEGSPLVSIMEKIRQKLQQQLSDTTVMMAMNYGEPSLKDTLGRCQEQAVERLIVLPLYPQYSATTTASCFDRITRFFQQQRFVPELHFINNYHQHPAYIQAIANAIREFWQQHGQQHLVFSFHGLPKRNVKLGDPYQQQCLTSAQLIASQLGLSDNDWRVVFQSRFGWQEWLTPYCDETLKQLPKQGIKQLHLMCPGFSVDCLETLEEINLQNREIFLEAGGESFAYIPCLNDCEAQINLLQQLIPCYQG